MISRREFLQVSAIGGLGILAHSGTLFGRNPTADRPNILWLSCEDISPHLGCYGYDNAVTPTLDGLAKRGFRFDKAYTTPGVCAPNRSSMITGIYAPSLGTHHMRSGGEGTERSDKPDLPPQITCFPEILREAGYYCTNNGKEDYNFETERQIWHESNRDDAHYAHRSDPDQPFFAVFNYGDTHEGSTRDTGEEHLELIDHLTPDQRQDPDELTPPPYYPDTEEVRRQWAEYYELITELDYWIDAKLQELEDAGHAGDTIVFFWSDHGVGFPRAKRWLYESGTHMPLIVYVPEKYQHLVDEEPGSVISRLVNSLDLGPTALNLAGQKIPEHMQGQPFLGPDLPEPLKYVYGARDRMDERYDIIRMVHNGRYQYFRNYEPYKPYHQFMNTPAKGHIMAELRRAERNGTLPSTAWWFAADSKPEEELYDVEEDPHQVNNLAGDPEYDEILTELRGAHREWMFRARDLGLIPEPELVRYEKELGSRYAIFHRNRDGEGFFRELHAIATLAGKPDQSALSALVEAARHQKPSIRYWAMIGLGNLGAAAVNAEGTARSALNDESEVVRVMAARALFHMERDDSGTLDVLISELESSHEWVRLKAAIVLDEVGEKARPAIPAMKQARQENKPVNKYVARVTNRALNQLLGTDNSVR